MGISAITGKLLELDSRDITGKVDLDSLLAWVDGALGRGVTLIGTAPLYRTNRTPNGSPSVAFSAGGFQYASGLTATASSEWDSSLGPANAIDGNASTYWHSATTSMPQWFQLESDGATAATEYRITTSSTIGGGPAAWTFEGSNDGSSWTTLDTRSGETWTAGESRTFTFSNSTAYSHYRIHVTAAHSAVGGGYLRWSEVLVPGAAAAPVGDGALVLFVKSNVPAGNTGAWSFGGSLNDSHYPYGGVVYDDTGTTNRDSFTPTLGIGSWRRYLVVLSGGTRTFYLDKTSQGSNTSLTPSWRRSPIVGRSQGGTYFDGEMAYLTLLDHAPDSSELDDIDAALVAAFVDAPTTPEGSGSGAWGWAGSGSGSTDHSGSGSGAWGWTGTGSGAAPSSTPTGSGSGAWGWAGSGSGSTDRAGSGTGEWGWTGSGTGTEGLPSGIPSGSGAGEWGWAGSGSGTAPAADGGWGWVGSVGAARPAPDVVLEPPVVAPAAVEERPLIRVSHRLVLAQDPVTGEYRGDGSHEIVREVVGVPHLWVDGLDVTYFQDRPVEFGDITGAIPGGSRVASVDFPQVSSLEARSLSWLRPHAPAEISIVRPGGGKIVGFSGHLISEGAGKGEKRDSVSWALEGDLGAAGHINLKVPVALPPVDVGVRIPKLLNEIPGRRFHAIAPFTSGIPTRKRGSYGDKVNGHVQDLLATAWTVDGNQLTIFPDPNVARRYSIGFKDLTPRWTISAGAPGVEVDLMWDWSQVVNAIYGYGTGPDGYAWAGWRFPGFIDYDPPDYPLPAGTSMRPGSSGSGVLTWKTRLIEMGWPLSSGSTYASSDAAKVRAFQTERGILVDGVVGPQTWNEVWNLGPRDLVAPERFPLAVLPAVEPYLYSETGRRLGPNPDFDPTVGRQETDIAYGAGVSLAEGIADAQIRLARDSEPGLVGELKLKSCPWEGSRWEVREGDALTLLQWRGEDHVLYVSQRKWSLDGREVTLTVDTKARDAMTLTSIIARERSSQPDPARRPGAVNRTSRTEQDQVVEFDGESPAGRFPRIAIRQGLWTVWVIPVSQVGRLVEVDFQTDSPLAEIAVVLFGKPITANRLEALVGPPLSRDNPFQDAAAELEAAGIIDGWGTLSQPGGHWPHGSDGPTTGRLRERKATEYVSQVPPWIWVAVGSNVSTHIQGRVKPPPSMA